MYDAAGATARTTNGKQADGFLTFEVERLQGPALAYKGHERAQEG